MQYREEERQYLVYDIEFDDPTKELQLRDCAGAAQNTQRRRSDQKAIVL